MKKKRTLGSADKLLLLAVLLLLAALTALFGSLIKSVHSQKKICQSVVPLGKYEYNALFLEQAEKLAGGETDRICSDCKYRDAMVQ